MCFFKLFPIPKIFKNDSIVRWTALFAFPSALIAPLSSDDIISALANSKY